MRNDNAALNLDMPPIAAVEIVVLVQPRHSESSVSIEDTINK